MQFLLLNILPVLSVALTICSCLQVYPGQPTPGSYAMGGTAVQGYVPIDQLPAPPPISGQTAPG